MNLRRDEKEVFKYFSEADIVISAAAVADFRPKEVFAER